MVAKKAVAGSQVLVLRAREGSGELLPPMRRAGLTVKDIGIYETVYRKQEHLQERLKEMFQAGEIDAVTFTSGSTVRGFAETFAGNLDLHRVQAICIGEQTGSRSGKIRNADSGCREGFHREYGGKDCETIWEKVRRYGKIY